jgi:TonB family protein
MRTQIHNILLGLLLLHPATHHALAADETENVANVKALVTYALSPQYPYEARAKRQTGSGVATLVIDPKTGVVTTAEMARSTGSQVLDSAALSAFRRWRFRPGLVTKANIPITFTMDGGVELMVREIKDVDASLAPFLGRGMVLSAPQPRYPLRPPWTNKQGKGIYEMHVGRDGKVEDVRILKIFRRYHLRQHYSERAA